MGKGKNHSYGALAWAEHLGGSGLEAFPCEVVWEHLERLRLSKRKSNLCFNPLKTPTFSLGSLFWHWDSKSCMFTEVGIMHHPQVSYLYQALFSQKCWYQEKLIQN